VQLVVVTWGRKRRSPGSREINGYLLLTGGANLISLKIRRPERFPCLVSDGFPY